MYDIVKVVPVTGNMVGLLSGAPSLEICAPTISNERSDTTIAELNTKVQVKVTSSSTVTMSEMPLLVSMREDGGGTTVNFFNYNMNSSNIKIKTYFEF